MAKCLDGREEYGKLVGEVEKREKVSCAAADHESKLHMKELRVEASVNRHAAEHAKSVFDRVIRRAVFAFTDTVLLYFPEAHH